MSLHALIWAFKAQCPSPTAKLVLLDLAERCDRVGRCWPSVNAVVRRTGLSERAVQYALTDLKKAGLASVETRYSRGRQLTSMYHLAGAEPDAEEAAYAPIGTPDVEEMVDDPEPTANCAPRGANGGGGRAQQVRQGGALGAHEPVIEPVKEEPEGTPYHPPTRSASLTESRNGRSPSGLTECDGSRPGFEWWYSLYPRHEGRGQAERAWKTAVKAAGSAEALIRALEQQNPELRERDPRYIPLPATWLNGKRWLDEPRKSLDERMIDAWENGGIR